MEHYGRGRSRHAGNGLACSAARPNGSPFALPFPTNRLECVSKPGAFDPKDIWAKSESRNGRLWNVGGSCRRLQALDQAGIDQQTIEAPSLGPAGAPIEC